MLGFLHAIRNSRPAVLLDFFVTFFFLLKLSTVHLFGVGNTTINHYSRCINKITLYNFQTPPTITIVYCGPAYCFPVFSTQRTGEKGKFRRKTFERRFRTQGGTKLNNNNNSNNRRKKPNTFRRGSRRLKLPSYCRARLHTTYCIYYYT